MRTPTISTITYRPRQVPGSPDEIQRYLSDELARIADVLQLVASGHLEPTYVAPAKPRVGNIRYADGTSWNPGTGEGVYVYTSAGWVKL